jgi:hypothetical protein
MSNDCEGQLRILLIEENAGDARLVRGMLSEAEGLTIHIQHVESLMTALDELARAVGTFDVALVDLSLKQSDSFKSSMS